MDEQRTIPLLLCGIVRLAHSEARTEEAIGFEMLLGLRPNDAVGANWHCGRASGIDIMVGRLLWALEILTSPDDISLLEELKADIEKMPPLNFELGAVQPPPKEDLEDLHGIFSAMSAARSNSKKKMKTKMHPRAGRKEHHVK